LKDSIEEEKFVKEESEEQITEWVSDIEEKLKAADEKVLELRQIQDEIVRKTQAIEKAEAMSRTWTSKILLSFTAVDVD
jgi:hypothetical protein